MEIRTDKERKERSYVDYYNQVVEIMKSKGVIDYRECRSIFMRFVDKIKDYRNYLSAKKKGSSSSSSYPPLWSDYKLLGTYKEDEDENTSSQLYEDYNKFYKHLESNLSFLSRKIDGKEKEKEKEKKRLLNIAVLGYSNDTVGYWDPSSIHNGLPGSEEAVVYACDILARKGHNVTIFMNPEPTSPWSLPSSNPRYIRIGLEANENILNEVFGTGTSKKKWDMVLLWRRPDFGYGKKLGDKVYFWGHDSPSYFPMTDPKVLDGIFYLSEHHRSQFRSFNPITSVIPYTISGNGIVPEQFPLERALKSRTNRFSIGYYSNYSRGLSILIDIWPEIHEKFPEATLSICYGRQTWGTMSDSDLKILTDKIEYYQNNGMGVREMGLLGHLELANLMMETSIWAYPCVTDAETFCITAVKAQAAGSIPVATRIGALRETIRPDTFTMEPFKDEIDKNIYKILLLSVLRKMQKIPEHEIIGLRRDFATHGRSYTWERCVGKWLELHESLSESKTIE